MNGFNEAACNPAADTATINVTVSEALWNKLDLGIPDTVQMFQDAASAFQFLAGALGSRSIDPHENGVEALIRFAARAMISAESRELAALGELDRQLREAAAERQRVKAAAQALAQHRQRERDWDSGLQDRLRAHARLAAADSEA